MPCKHHGPTAELSHSSMVHLPCSLTKHFSNVLNPITRKKNLHDFYIKPCGLLLHQALIPLDIEMCKYSSYSYYTDHKQLFCWVALVSFYLSCMHILWECAEISGFPDNNTPKDSHSFFPLSLPPNKVESHSCGRLYREGI